MDCSLIILGSSTTSDNTVIFTTVDNIIYCTSDVADDIGQRIVDLDYSESYVNLSTYKGTVELPEGTVLLPEIPDNFEWKVVEEYYPDYQSSNDVFFSDRLSCYIDDELNPLDTCHFRDIVEIEAGKPEYLTNMEWAIHQSTALDTELFLKACEVRDNPQ